MLKPCLEQLHRHITGVGSQRESAQTNKMVENWWNNRHKQRENKERETEDDSGRWRPVSGCALF